MNVELQAGAPARKGWSPAAAERNGEIEVLRAVAIFMVLAQHLPFNLVFWPWRWSGPLFHAGTWSGVDLFFAVSGYVIARGLLPQLAGVHGTRAFLRVAVPFWIRRAWRLWPSAWLWLALPLPLCLLFNQSQAFGNLQANWSMAVAAFCNLGNVYIAQHPAHSAHPVAFPQWSLSLEEQFYMVLPFAALICRRYLPLLLGLLLLFAFILPVGTYTLAFRSGAFAAGVLLAIASRRPAYADCAPRFLARSRLARLAVLAGAVALLVSFGDTSWNIVSFMLGPIAVISGLLVWVASYDQGLLWPPGRTRRVLEYVAARSYSIYLVHIPVFLALHEIWFRRHGLVNPTRPEAVAYFAVAALGVLAVAELNYRLLEQPLRAHGKVAARRYAQHLREETA